MRGWIVRPDGSGSHLRWGRELRLDPAFAEPPLALLGHADFFSQLTITFANDGPTRLLHVDVDAHY